MRTPVIQSRTNRSGEVIPQLHSTIRSETGKIAIIAAVCAALAIGLAVSSSSHAGVFSQQFRSPSGDISCNLVYYPPKAARLPPGGNFVQCDIGNHSWAHPQPPPADRPDYTSTFVLMRGQMPIVGYRGGTFVALGPTLDYGQTQSAGAITCSSEQSAMKCTDVSTGHFFRVSQESYELG